jgi:hypothetical protein
MADMVALEKALAALYLACSEKYPEDSKFWLAICHQEEAHARYITELAALIASHPGEFKFGRQFNVVAIRNITSRVDDFADQVRKGQVDRKHAFFMARDIEGSVLEARYHEIVSTDNLEFKKSIDRITRETASHKSLLAAKLARSQGL